jgi:hypothetical protein
MLNTLATILVLKFSWDSFDEAALELRQLRFVMRTDAFHLKHQLSSRKAI